MPLTLSAKTKRTQSFHAQLWSLGNGGDWIAKLKIKPENKMNLNWNEAGTTSRVDFRDCPGKNELFSESMNKPVIPRQAPRPAEKLALAQAAFREFHARCFWFMRPDAEIVTEEIPYLCERLRADGGRRGFYLAAELCR